MNGQVIVAGGGIGGLAAALAVARTGAQTLVFEQASGFGEAGAGIQLGPNAVRVLQRWGMTNVVAAHASRPGAVRVHRAADGTELARLPLAGFEVRYGAPYLTIHRADLHGVLAEAAATAGVQVRFQQRIVDVAQRDEAVRVEIANAGPREADLLVGADGLWSAVRAHVQGSAAPAFTGDLAYRALASTMELPPALRSDDVRVWLGPQLHAVAYPVRGGEAMNLVVITAGRSPADPSDWDHAAALADLAPALVGAGQALRDLVGAMPTWRMWPVYERAPVASAAGMARGRVALLGDAAHPMRPYLAQGAGMALEDADLLGRVLVMARECDLTIPTALQRYALQRWPRCARVQAASRRNATVFHASGPLRVARDLALRTVGAPLLDNAWLYRG